MEMIRDNETEGITPAKLAKETNLSRQAVQAHLKKLTSEERIYKTIAGNNTRYFPQNNLLNDTDLFAITMADRFMAMIDKRLIPPLEEMDLLKGIPADQPLHQYPDIDFSQTKANPSSHHFFLKAISGMSVSEDYCKNKFTNGNIIERNLYEFINRVGAYIAYIFIESLRPIPKDTDATENKKKERTLLLVNKAIPVERLFRKFCLLLSELGIMRNMDLHISEDGMSEELQLNQSSFDSLSDSFKRMYPRVYNALENFWFNSRKYHLKRHSLFAKYSKCIHKWEDYHLYKIGNCYICNKCHLMKERKVKGRGKNKEK